MPKKKPARDDLKLLDRFWREPVVRSVLPNGLTLIVKPDRSAALASVQVWVRTGSIHEGDRLGGGMSHYLEHLLFKGTERRSGREISSTVQAHGGYINAYTTFDRTVYYIDLPSEHAGIAIDLLADAVLHSTLPADEVAREKDVILREIAMTRDDPDDRLWEAMFSAAFREHPYRQPVIGHRDVFTSLTREDLVSYYKSRYIPNNMVLVVAGDVDPSAVRTAAEAGFGAAPRSALAPVYVPDEPGQLAPREERRFEDVEVTRAAIAWKVPGITHLDAPVLDILAMVLGHGDSSILWRELREKSGLVHTVDASCWNPGTSGLFCVSLTCEPAKRAPAEAALERLLTRRETSGFTRAEVDKSLRQLLAGEVSSRQTMSGQASKLGAAEVVAGDLNYSRSYFERLGSVGPADLKRVLRTYLRPVGRTSISIDPAAAAAAPAPHAGGAGSVPDFKEIRLPNGARLILAADPRLPNLHLRVLVEGGPLTEEPGKRGSSALLATLLSKDTANRSAAEIAESIESTGGSFYPFFGNNSLGLAAEVLPTDLDRALSVLSDAVLNPAFKPSTLELERASQLASLRQDSDDVVLYARKLLRKRFFGPHPLALDAYGDEGGVAALTRADLSALHRRLFVARNVVLAVAGDFDPAELTRKARAFLARLRKDPFRAPAPPAVDFPAERGEFSEKREREQAVVLEAYPSPPLHAADYDVGDVADELFSGMASKLFERVREEKALAYFVRSTRISGLDAAMFGFLAGTQPGREAEVLAEIEAEIKRVQAEEVDDAELHRCKTRLKAARRQGLQTNSARAMQAGLNALQGRPLNDWKDYGARIDAVTREDLGRFARTYLQRARRTQLIVRP